MRLSRTTIWVVLLLWGAAMGLSANALLQDPTGDGFTGGLNRVMGFLSWQLAGAIVSLGLWFGVRPLPKGDLLRWLGRVPGWWSVVALIGFLGLIAYSFVAVRLAEREAIEAMLAPPAATQTAPALGEGQ